MATVTTILATDIIAASRVTLNTNFSNLNTDKVDVNSTYADPAWITSLAGSKITGNISVFDATINNTTPITGVTQLIVRAGAGQASTNLQTWQNSGGTALAAILPTGQYRFIGVTVASLPAAAAANAGAIAYVTDANATTIGTTVAGGGANTVLVWSNGADWRIYAN
jgi:hypothetical protein